ncbi:extensin-like domain-containing protein [Roseobacter sp. CCS2]|uniref:extensin-like domain-containing protein n=1 Tax=Roseobacter sp. CCS2 TaxID=391593 RepID=UPI0000F402DC|nr:extensin family protein [Roseobacter sp. CCS2]EBA14216.1 Extensin-like protein [Roseobacter sp. CCS2]
MRHAKRQQMAQEAAEKQRKKRERSGAITSGIAAFLFAGVLAFVGYQAIVHPDTPLPREWNPTQPLRISDPVTAMTGWKLNQAVSDQAQCLAALDGHAALQSLGPLEDTEQCFITDRVDLRAVGQSRLAPVETRCAIALRLAMWERHSVQPAAQEFLGSTVSSIDHFGSYNCRAMRTGSGPSTRMSTHATADAIDIAGFGLANGTRIRLLADWEAEGPRRDFLRAVRNGACDWFNLTLSPDYNRLHADHFHLQSRGWGLCR